MAYGDDSYTGPDFGMEDPSGGVRPPGIPEDWYYDPLQGVWVPAPSVINAPPQPAAPEEPPPPSLANDTRGFDDTPAGPSPGSLGALGGLGGAGTLTAPFTDTFTPPTPGGVPSWLPSVPGLTLPQFRAPDPFRQTSAEDVTADPGYQFLLGEGQKGVQQSAAARGLLNSGGTLKDIARWTEDYAGTRFNDVDSRRRNDYMLNYQTQTLDPYRFAYQSALDAYAPQLTGWTTGAAAAQRQNEGDYSNAWNQFLFNYDKFRDQRDSTWSKASQVLMA